MKKFLILTLITVFLGSCTNSTSTDETAVSTDSTACCKDTTKCTDSVVVICKDTVK